MRRLTGFLTTLCLVLTMLSPSVYAAEESSISQAFMPVIQEYERAISMENDAINHANEFNYVGGIGFGGYQPTADTVYALYDINHDGTDEMLVGRGSDSGTRSIIELYYLENGMIGKLFDDTFNYRTGLHIGIDGTIMLEGSINAWCSVMTVYSADNLALPVPARECYYDSTNEQSLNGTKLSKEEYDKIVSDYIINGLDYASLDWIFFVTPSEGKYDPYPNNAVSGVYRENVDWVLEQGMSVAGYNQFIFNDAEGTFEFSLNLPDGWATVSGTYTENKTGHIDCSIEKRSFGYDYGHGNITDLYLQQQGDSIYLTGDYWTSEYYVDRGQMFFDYVDHFSVTPDSGVATVTGDEVRIRSGPGTDYTILFALNSGATVDVTGKTDGWYRIEYSNNGYTLVGYMSADYIAKR